MSLPHRERKALREIEAGIRRSDPGLARLLGDFHGRPAGQDMPHDEREPGGAARACARALAVSASAARLVGHGTVAAAAAVCAPGVRERLGVRGRPQPMARSSWQRLT